MQQKYVVFCSYATDEIRTWLSLFVILNIAKHVLIYWCIFYSGHADFV